MSSLPKILLIIETDRTYGRRLLRGIAQYAMMNGPWDIEYLAPFYLQKSQRIGDISQEMVNGFDGIIMREQKNVQRLIRSGVPIVFASYLRTDLGVPTIRSSAESIARLAFKYFRERGFERFAFAGYDGMFWSDDRKELFAKFVQKAGCSFYGYACSKERKRREWADDHEILADWLKQLPKPIALLTCNDDRAQQVLKACRRAELSVPEEIAIVGIDNDEFVCTLAHPPLSSISLGLEIAGYEAASVLDRMIQGEKLDDLVIPVDANSIVTRQSSDILAIGEPLIAQAVKFIREHVREPIQIDDIVDHLPVSRRCLCDRFKKSMGYGVHQYIKKQRIAYMEQLLVTTDMSISDIAYHMGFSSDEHIAAYFRSVKSVNLHKYRLSRKDK